MAETRPCPLCTSDVPWPWPPHCPYCAAPLRSDAARELAELDAQLAALGTFAVLGLLLVAFSPSYERQRRRLAAARSRLAALR